MNLLGGKEERTCLEIEERVEEQEQQETGGQREIDRKEVWKQLAKLKKGKSPGSDGIDNET